MRLSAKVFCCGKRGLVRFPRLHAEPDSCYDGNGRLNTSAAHNAIAGDGVMISDKDNGAVMAITMEIMRQMEASLGHIASSDSSFMDVSLGWKPKNASDARIKKKLEKTERRTARLGKDFIAIRIDVRYVKSRGVVVTISMSDPNDMIGGGAALARNTAVAIAIIALHIKSSLPNNGFGMEVEDGGFCEGLIDEAVFAETSIKEMRKHEEAVKKSMSCERNHNGYCSPVDFNCELCKAGKCVVPPPPERTWQ